MICFLFTQIYSFLNHRQNFYRTWLWVTWRVSFKKRELLTIRVHFCLPCFFGGKLLFISFVFCVVLLCCLREDMVDQMITIVDFGVFEFWLFLNYFGFILIKCFTIVFSCSLFHSFCRFQWHWGYFKSSKRNVCMYANRIQIDWCKVTVHQNTTWEKPFNF